MRLLFDEQLSEALCLLLRDVFADSLHVRQVGAGGAPDSTVWQLAEDRGCSEVAGDERRRLSPLEHPSRRPTQGGLAASRQLHDGGCRTVVARARCRSSGLRRTGGSHVSRTGLRRPTPRQAWVCERDSHASASCDCGRRFGDVDFRLAGYRMHQTALVDREAPLVRVAVSRVL